MPFPRQFPNPFASRPTSRPAESLRLRRAEVVAIALGLIAAILQHGLRNLAQAVWWEMGLVVLAVMLFLTVSIALRFRWSLARPSFFERHRVEATTSVLWLAGCLLILVFGRGWRSGFDPLLNRGVALVALSEVCLALRAAGHLIRVTRRATAGVKDPAVVLVASFGALIVVGTILLMLPKAYADPALLDESFARRFRHALFTSTSATCVTGLTVVNTGGTDPYWSRTGQVVILCLFQIGGLGIMTFGAFFAIAAGRDVPIRESATMADVFESEQVGHVRRLVATILVFTLASELLGAALLWNVWDGLPAGERLFFSVFHSVSAFCNAGFALTESSFVGMGTHWQVWGAIAGLIIVGGLGFAVIYNLVLVTWSRFRDLKRDPLLGLSRSRVRLTLTSRLVLIATAALLAAGAVGYLVLESPVLSVRQTEAVGVHDTAGDAPLTRAAHERIAEAWFQSVTFRTAGFNTVDHAALQPGTKLFAVLLMFIGASPGSTGGGIKTTCFALAILGLLAILRGRTYAETHGRRIPDLTIKRAFAVISLALAVVMSTTMLLVIFEHRPERFLDHLFEATSAFATVGVSSIGTGSLTVPSQYVIIATMFLGRVGPLTLLLALAGRARDARYDYPAERVTLG